MFSAYQRHQLAVESDPNDYLLRTFAARMAPVRKALADYVHADPNDLVLLANTTTAMNLVARSLHLQPGDEILSSDQEYGAIDKVWEFICEQTGARYVRQPLPMPAPSAEAIADAIWAGVTDKTRVLSISHIAAQTSLVLPVAELAARARSRGIVSVIDGAHAPGQIDLDLQAIGADIYIGNCHKWLGAPRASALLYVRRDWHERLEPLVISWGWRPWQPGPSRLVDDHQWPGTFDVAARLAIVEAIDFAKQVLEPGRQRCHDLVVDFAREAHSGLGLCALGALAATAQMVTLALPDCDAFALGRQLLQDDGIDVAVNKWSGRPHLRVSVQVYNDFAELDRLLQSLHRILRPVR